MHSRLCSSALAAMLTGCSFASFGVDTEAAGESLGEDAGDSETDSATDEVGGDGDGGDGDAGDGDGSGGDGDGSAGDGDGTAGDGDGDDCGNGLIDVGESCDGVDLAGADCTSLGFVVAPGLACGPQCQFDPTGCTAFCGNGIIEPTESCEDMNTNPDDGCDACHLTGVTCGSAIPLLVGFGPPVVQQGSTIGGGFHDSEGCELADASPDRVHVIESVGSGFVSVWLDRAGTPFDAQLYTLEDCTDPGSPSMCVDLKSPTPTQASGEVLSFWSPAGQRTNVVVDGSNGASGPYTLSARLSAGTCGDPVVVPFWPGGARPHVGRTTAQPDGPPSSCGGAGSGEVVYRVDAIGGGSVEIIAPQSESSFPMVGSVRAACEDVATELVCDGSGDVVMSFPGTMGSSNFVIVDGAGGASGEYGFVIGG